MGKRILILGSEGYLGRALRRHLEEKGGYEILGVDNGARERNVKEALKNYDMWFSGIRLDEGFTRNDFKHIEERGGLVKVNPILDFTEKDIWRYIALNEIKVNPIYRKGYRSLSCKRCSAPEKNELETERAGRWVGTDSEGGECGIHTKSLRN